MIELLDRLCAATYQSSAALVPFVGSTDDRIQQWAPTVVGLRSKRTRESKKAVVWIDPPPQARPTSGPATIRQSMVPWIDRGKRLVGRSVRLLFGWGPHDVMPRGRSRTRRHSTQPDLASRPGLASSSGERCSRRVAPNPASSRPTGVDCPSFVCRLSDPTHPIQSNPYTQPHASHRQKGTGSRSTTPQGGHTIGSSGGETRRSHRIDRIVIGVIAAHGQTTNQKCGGPSPRASWRCRSRARPWRRRATRYVLLHGVCVCVCLCSIDRSTWVGGSIGRARRPQRE